jgi:septum formation protein
MIYLASRSPRRRRLLKELGVDFRAMAPGYEERNDGRLSPARLVKRHALGKARSIVPAVSEGTVLGCDTVVAWKGQVIGKPATLAEAARMLGGLQGRTHTVYTGVALLDIRGGKVCKTTLFHEKTRVTLKALTPAAIHSYLRRIGPLDKAGAYAIQSRRRQIVVGFQGSMDNAAGLPVETLRPLLRRCRGAGPQAGGSTTTRE